MHRIRAFFMPKKIWRHPTPCLRCNDAGKSSSYDLERREVDAAFFCPHCSKYNYIMNKNQNGKTMRLEMVKVNQSRFAAEILNGNASINLTQMSQPFGRSFRPGNWLKTEEAQRYIKAIAVATNRATADLVEVRQGGSPENQGTWCKDYRIALRYAQWLSPEFSILVDEEMLRLLSGKGVTERYPLKPSRQRLPMPKDRDEVLGAFYAELPKWVTLENEREVAKFFGVSRHHVHEVLMGRRTGYTVLAALTEHGSQNRKKGIRRADLRPAVIAAKTRQLALEFADETKEDGEDGTV